MTDDAIHDDPWRLDLQLGVRIALLLIGFFVLEWWFLRVGRLAEPAYEGPIIALEVMKGLVSFRYGLVTGIGTLAILAGLVGLAVRRPKALTETWRPFGDFYGVRFLVAVVTLTLAWAYSTYDYNLYFDRAHLVDRLLLIALAVGVVWRPVFVFPFVVHVIAIVWQFSHPIGPYSVAEQFGLVRILMVFAALLAVRVVAPRVKPSEFIYLAVIILAASYLKCGLGKAGLGRPDHPFLNWLTHGHIYYLLLATHANGWLSFVNADTITSIATNVGKLDVAMLVGTIVLECGALFVLFRRRLLLFFLVGWVLFHGAVFAMSGICFWKWVLVDLAIFGIFLSRNSVPIFTTSHFVYSIPIVLGGLTWFDPVNLAWYDSPVSYTYRFVGVGESGTRYSLYPQEFAPYDYQFTLAPFHFLADEPGFQVAMGAMWDRDAVDELVDAGSMDDVERIEHRRGENVYSADRAREMDVFLDRYLSAFAARGSKSTILSVVKAPPQLWTFSPDDAYAGQEPIAAVEITQLTSFFDGDRYEVGRERELRRVPITGRAAAP